MMKMKYRYYGEKGPIVPGLYPKKPGCVVCNYEKKTYIVLGWTNGNKTAKLILAADFGPSNVHTDVNYCYLRAIKLA